MSGTITHIHIAPRSKAPMVAVEQAVALAGLGLEGDRYAAGKGEFSTWPKDHELTLIDQDTLDLLMEEHGIRLAPGEHRRNLTTTGIDLFTLIGRKFKIGEVLCEGTRPAPPCAHLERVLHRPGLCALLHGRAGIRARILIGGVIFVGDRIELLPGEQLGLEL